MLITFQIKNTIGTEYFKLEIPEVEMIVSSAPLPQEVFSVNNFYSHSFGCTI